MCCLKDLCFLSRCLTSTTGKTPIEIYGPKQRQDSSLPSLVTFFFFCCCLTISLVHLQFSSGTLHSLARHCPYSNTEILFRYCHSRYDLTKCSLQGFLLEKVHNNKVRWKYIPNSNMAIVIVPYSGGFSQSSRPLLLAPSILSSLIQLLQ